MTRLLTILTQLCMCITFALMFLAHLYETEAYGLHPWIAIPLATLFFILPHLVDDFFTEEEETDTSCIRLRNQ